MLVLDLRWRRRFVKVIQRSQKDGAIGCQPQAPARSRELAEIAAAEVGRWAETEFDDRVVPGLVGEDDIAYVLTAPKDGEHVSSGESIQVDICQRRSDGCSF